MRRLLFSDQLHQRICKAKLGIGVFPFRSDPGTADKGIIGPENKGKGIEKKDFLFHASKVRSLPELRFQLLQVMTGGDKDGEKGSGSFYKRRNPVFTLGETGHCFY